MSGFPSPNCGPRRGGATPRLVVIHYTAMQSFSEARARLCDPAAEVSAHWLIGRDGRAEALVDESLRAWHAGAGAWGGVADVNSASIGIELVNGGNEPFAAPQTAALARLLAGVMDRWGIPARAVIGHADMAPERKRDPGPRFDWRALARQGLSVWPVAAPAAPDPGAFGTALTRFGYPPADQALRLAAFRMRFFPGLSGDLTAPLSAAEAGAALDLAARFPVDGTAAGA